MTVERYDNLKGNYAIRGMMLDTLQLNLADMSLKYAAADAQADHWKYALDEMTIAYQEQKKIARRKSISMWTFAVGFPAIFGSLFAILR